MKKIVIFAVFLVLIPVCGISQNRYVLHCDERLIIEAEKVIISQVGITEKTNKNDGEVEKYTALLNLPKGSPYCAAGLYWSFYVATNNLNKNIQNIPFPKSGLANAIYNYAKQNGKRSKYRANKGDFIVWRHSDSPFGHIEYIYETSRGGNVKTVGFNTSKIIGKRKIEGVFEHRRNIMHPLGRMKIRGLVGFGNL